MNAKKWLIEKSTELGVTKFSELTGLTRPSVYQLRGQATIPQRKTCKLIAAAMTADGINKGAHEVQGDFAYMAGLMFNAMDVDKVRPATENGPAHNFDGSTT